MTVEEMHYDFLFKMDRVHSQSKEDFNTAEIDWLLNEAQSMYIKRNYSGLNNQIPSFEETQKQIDDLKNLVIKFPLQPGITPIQHGPTLYEVPLISLAYSYMFLIRGTVEVTLTNCLSVANLRLVQHDDLNYALQDPFNKSSQEEVLANFGKATTTGASIYLYPSTAIGNVFLEYIKHPEKISKGDYTYIDGNIYPQQSSELSEHCHQEIVDIATEIASGIIENPSYLQMKTQKVFTNQ